jgi:hypothetical protein
VLTVRWPFERCRTVVREVPTSPPVASTINPCERASTPSHQRWGQSRRAAETLFPLRGAVVHLGFGAGRLQCHH